MANIDKSQMHDFVNGETVDETKLDQNFDVLRVGANDTNTKVNAISANGAIGTTNLADNAVTTPKITDANVTTAKLADGSVTTAKLADNSVTGAKIVDATITNAEIATGTITQDKLVTGTLDNRYYTETEIDTKLALKANLVSPTFTGTVTVPAPTNNTDASTKQYVDSSITALDGATQTGLGLKVSKSGDTMTGPLTLSGAPSADLHASTKKYVDDSISVLTNGAPALLNTLDELAQALGDDPNFATTMTNQLAAKAPLASPTFTGTVSLPTTNVYGNVDFNQNQAIEFVAEKLTSDPVSPVESQIYYNTVSKQFRIYKGSSLGWVDISGQGAVVLDKEFTATAGQTVFDLSSVGQYATGTNALTVFKNGVLLRESQYTETSATVVTLTSGASAGDIVYIRWFYQNPALLTSYVSKSGDTITGKLIINTTVAGDVAEQIVNNSAVGYGMKVVLGNTTNYALAISGTDYVNKAEVYADGKAYFAGNVGIGTAPSSNKLDVVGTSKIQEVKEKVRILALNPTSEGNIELLSGAVVYYTTANSANFTLNFKGDASTTMNTFLATGESATVTVLVTNGATPYYPNVIQIDGTTVTPKWNGGTAISAGNASAIDIYTFTIIKTASATYTVLASQAKFA